MTTQVHVLVKYSDFSKTLLLQPGIIRIELLTDDVINDLRRIEFSPMNFSFMPVDPVGFSDIASRDLKIILFCTQDFYAPLEPFMDLIDSRGTRIGHDIRESEKHLYDSPDYIWLTDTMFFDVSLITEFEMKCVIHSVNFKVEGMPDSIKARAFFPCTSSVAYLFDKYGATGKVISAIMVGVEGVEF
jgi:hypothetical protein